jgi:hypothetical protein
MISIILRILILLVLPINCLAQWVEVASSPSSTYYVNEITLVYFKNKVIFDGKVVYKNKPPVYQRILINCDNWQYCILNTGQIFLAKHNSAAFEAKEYVCSVEYLPSRLRKLPAPSIGTPIK